MRSNLVSAAGSLDFCELGPAMAELARVARPGGWVLVYDFAVGRSSPDDASLAQWFPSFRARYPPPKSHRAAPTVDSFERAGLVGVEGWAFGVTVPLERDAYTAYLLTESNVGAALDRSEHHAEIERWLSESLPWPPGATWSVEFPASGITATTPESESR